MTLLQRSKLRLGRHGLVAYEPGTATTLRFDREETVRLLQRDVPFERLDEPCEVVHLEISDRCNLSCPYCYIGKKEGQKLSTEQWRTILDDLASYGVLQVTFGGGEPTLREDLRDLAIHARRLGLNLCMTTNGQALPELGADVLCLFSQVNVSHHGDELVVWNALQHLEKHNIQRGVNFLAMCEYLPQLPFMALVTSIFDAELLLLTAKGIPDAVAPQIVMTEARRLHDQGFKVAVDGLTCSGELPDFCMQKRRFCDVDSLGNVLPCSFVREPLGNLLENGFAEIWRSRGGQVPCPFTGGEKE
jgi:MoaA/NifB/PqqE/SkfB family radical SAM enzyme